MSLAPSAMFLVETGAQNTSPSLECDFHHGLVRSLRLCTSLSTKVNGHQWMTVSSSSIRSVFGRHRKGYQYVSIHSPTPPPRGSAVRPLVP
jgi:hypothetical protein